MTYKTINMQLAKGVFSSETLASLTKAIQSLEAIEQANNMSSPVVVPADHWLNSRVKRMLEWIPNKEGQSALTDEITNQRVINFLSILSMMVRSGYVTVEDVERLGYQPRGAQRLLSDMREYLPVGCNYWNELREEGVMGLPRTGSKLQMYYLDPSSSLHALAPLWALLPVKREYPVGVCVQDLEVRANSNMAYTYHVVAKLHPDTRGVQQHINFSVKILDADKHREIILDRGTVVVSYFNASTHHEELTGAVISFCYHDTLKHITISKETSKFFGGLLETDDYLHEARNFAKMILRGEVDEEMYKQLFTVPVPTAGSVSDL